MIEVGINKTGILHLSVYTLSRQGHNIYRKKACQTGKSRRDDI